jgi:hypothetical protein
MRRARYGKGCAQLMWLMVAVLAAGGCGGADPSSDLSDAAGTLPSGTSAFLPWAEGNSWSYQVTEGQVASTKITTIGPLEAVGGEGPNRQIQAHRVTTSKGAAGTDQTVSWQAQQGERVLRYVKP